jgi:hypothetical protein
MRQSVQTSGTNLNYLPTVRLRYAVEFQQLSQHDGVGINLLSSITVLPPWSSKKDADCKESMSLLDCLNGAQKVVELRGSFCSHNGGTAAQESLLYIALYP